MRWKSSTVRATLCQGSGSMGPGRCMLAAAVTGRLPLKDRSNSGAAEQQPRQTGAQTAGTHPQPMHECSVEPAGTMSGRHTCRSAWLAGIMHTAERPAAAAAGCRHAVAAPPSQAPTCNLHRRNACTQGMAGNSSAWRWYMAWAHRGAAPCVHPAVHAGENATHCVIRNDHPPTRLPHPHPWQPSLPQLS